MRFLSKRTNYLKLLPFLFILATLAIYRKNPILLPFFSAKAQCKNCNVILVSVDTLSANHLPCYGYSRNTAPNLCTFAQNNIHFTNAYANATWTLPGHVSMLTGLFPYYHRVLSSNDHLDSNTPILPEILQQHGYKTIFLLPKDDFTMPVSKVYNRGIDTLIEYEGRAASTWDQPIEEFQKSVTAGQKTFLFLHTYYVHAPYTTEDRALIYADALDDSVPLKSNDIYQVSEGFITYLREQLHVDLAANKLQQIDPLYQVISETLDGQRHDAAASTKTVQQHAALLYQYFFNYNYRNKIQKSDANQVEYLRALYDQRIHEMDTDFIPRVLSLVKKKGFKDNTVVIFTADHGEEFMEHGAIEHETIYNSNVSVPLIFYIPGIPKKAIDTPAQYVDIVPTILDLLDIKPTKLFQGESLTDLIRGVATQKRLLVIDGGEPLNQKALVWDDWKLFIQKDGATHIPYELYDMSRDKNETNNILFSHMEVAGEMLKRYISYQRQWPDR